VVPKGAFVLMHANLFHAGDYGWPRDLNPRLHFYLRRKAKAKAKDAAFNTYPLPSLTGPKFAKKFMNTATIVNRKRSNSEATTSFDNN